MTEQAVTDPLASFGEKIDVVSVQITYRIIELFSEGLYSSPNKAVEELVANSFDANATEVWVSISPDRSSEDASIAVIDNGDGMTPADLQAHWVIGASRKRDGPVGKRKPIGKFGIGKLSTFVLARHFTHITRSGGKFYSVTMDYNEVPTDTQGVFSAQDPATVQLPLRELSEDEARVALGPWLMSAGAPDLFDSDLHPTWTAAILTQLKPMAADIRRGTLRWVLRTAMPLRDDFVLTLNGELIESSSLDRPKIGRWVIGQEELQELPKPASDELDAIEDTEFPEDSLHRFGLTHPSLGRITGYIEVFEDSLTGRKADDIERSNGFFVYVRGRLVNVDDAGFGIDRNQLRYGTFSRFRAVVHIDRLDDELRSSRERFREGPAFQAAQNLLRGLFNFARGQLEQSRNDERPVARLRERFDASAASLTVSPIIDLVEKIHTAGVIPRMLRVKPLEPSQGEKYVEKLRTLLTDDTRSWITALEREDLADHAAIALLDVDERILIVNTLHPFVAQFIDEFENTKQNLPLELLALSEVLLEANLYASGAEQGTVHEALDRRDLLLRELARNTGHRNAFTVAMDLLDSTQNADQLEIEVVSAFNSMGYDAVRKGKKGNPDGLAFARLSPGLDGQVRGYTISLEAKSKKSTQKRKVSAKTVNVSSIARHRREHGCQHAVVVAPDFATTLEDDAALIKEAVADRDDGMDEDGNPTRTITLIRVKDLAQLVRLVPYRRITLHELREMLMTCVHPDEVAAWIHAIAEREVARPPYSEVLEAIWAEQGEAPGSRIAYAALRVSLRYREELYLNEEELRVMCHSMADFADGYMHAHSESVELNQGPDRVLAAIGTIEKKVEQELNL